MIVVLAGGVGAARFLQGLVQVVPQQRLTAIVNTGDDRDFYGLHVSPDLDIVMYTLAGVVDEAHGWGIRNDTYATMQQLARYGNEDWFLLGDRDLATHIHRTQLLRQGRTLSEVTEELGTQFGLELRILTMSDQPSASLMPSRLPRLSSSHRAIPSSASAVFWLSLASMICSMKRAAW